MNVFYVSVSRQKVWAMKLSINSLCPKPSTLQVKCLTVACVAVMSSVAERESLPKYTLMSYVYPDAKTFPFLGNILPENNSALEFYNYLVHCQMLQEVVEFRVSLIQGVKDGPYFP